MEIPAAAVVLLSKTLPSPPTSAGVPSLEHFDSIVVDKALPFFRAIFSFLLVYRTATSDSVRERNLFFTAVLFR